MQNQEKTGIDPFEVGHALVGLEANEHDKPLLKYFDFFTNHIPIASTSFVHAENAKKQFELLQTEAAFQQIIDDFHQKLERRISEQVEQYMTKKEGVHTETLIKLGKPLEALLNVATEIEADLVVIGQKKGVSHHGIFAKQFARDVKCHALVVPEKSSPAISKILVPVDFSENSCRALKAAIGIQKQMNKPVKIMALNVFQLPNFSLSRIFKSEENFKNKIRAKVEKQFEEFLSSHVPDEKDNVERHLLLKTSPNMGGYIYSFAADKKVDFLVMGAKGHSKVELLVLGSVTEKILSINQTFPTLIVK